MKLVFEKADGRIQVSIIDNGTASAFSYPALINHLYVNRGLEDSEFAGDDITPEEQASVCAMIEEIKTAVLNPQHAGDDRVIETGDAPLNEEDIPF